ncbi:MAG: glycosyltransferase family 2 protein [Patescibacteria group bacterium]|jgi:hypothetical protein
MPPFHESEKAHPRVSIVVLNWNGFQDTCECVDSLRALTYPNFEVFIVDNASSGDDAKRLSEKFGSFIRLKVNDANLGFSGGNNTAIRQIVAEGQSHYIVLLNNDTAVKENFLTELVHSAQTHKNAAIFGPKAFFYSFKGRRNVICSTAGTINWYVSPGYFQKDKYKSDQELNDSAPREAKWISGACMMIDAKKIDPLLNESYYFGCEDIDKCLKAKVQGLTTLYVPTSIIWHKVGASRPRALRFKIREILTSYKLMKYHNPAWLLATPSFFVSAVIKFLKKKVTS